MNGYRLDSMITCNKKKKSEFSFHDLLLFCQIAMKLGCYQNKTISLFKYYLMCSCC